MKKLPDDRVQKIIAWRNAIISLPDSVFFDLMRMHLGELKTPYTKQKLIEDLGSFLQTDAHKKTILALLSPFDIAVLAAVIHIPLCTANMLFSFFNGEPYIRVYNTILNLEERLLVFRLNSKTDEKTILAVTPYFEEALREKAPRGLLFALKEEKNNSAQEIEPRGESLLASRDFWAAVFAFVLDDGDVCKADGVLKKRAQNRLREVFGGVETERLDDAVEALCAAARNLGLFEITEKGFVPVFGLWDSFAALTHKERLAYLAAAFENSSAAEREIKQAARLLYRVVESIPQDGCTKTVLFRTAFFEQAVEAAREKNAATSRFNSLVYKTRAARVDSEMLKALVERAVLFGLVAKKSDDSGLFFCAQNIVEAEPVSPAPPLVKIDSIFSITIFPGLPLGALLSLLQFLTLTKFDVVMHCELTKESAMRAFAAGRSPKQILDLLEKFSGAGIAQNVSAAVMEWHEAYTSVFLYKGYVLRAAPKYTAKIERLPVLAGRIKQTLAEGIYLMDFADDAEAASILAHCGFAQGGEIKTVQHQVLHAAFSRIHDAPKIDVPQIPPVVSPVDENESGKIIDSLLQKLDGIFERAEMTNDQYESLKNRIRQKIIIDESQLNSLSVKQEKTEARGMDFLGKMLIIDQALVSHSSLEIEDRGKKIIGTPIGIEKQPGGAAATFIVEETKTHVRLSVSQLQSVKKLRESIFKNVKF